MLLDRKCSYICFTFVPKIFDGNSSALPPIYCLHYCRHVSLLFHVKTRFNGIHLFGHKQQIHLTLTDTHVTIWIAQCKAAPASKVHGANMLAPWTLLSGAVTPLLTRRHRSFVRSHRYTQLMHRNGPTDWRIHMRATGQVLHTDVKCL